METDPQEPGFLNGGRKYEKVNLPYVQFGGVDSFLFQRQID